MTTFCTEYDTWLDSLYEESIEVQEGVLTAPEITSIDSTQDKQVSNMTTFFYTVGNECYSGDTEVTPHYTASITKRFVGGMCVEAILAYEIDGNIHTQIFGVHDRHRPMTWKLCHAEDLAERKLKKVSA